MYGFAVYAPLTTTHEQRPATLVLDLVEDRPYITQILIEVFMNRTQIYLNPAQQKALNTLAARTGRTQTELIRDAIDQFVGERKASGRASVIKRSAGLWKGREDLPDFAAVRREADRVSTRPRSVAG